MRFGRPWRLEIIRHKIRLVAGYFPDGVNGAQPELRCLQARPWFNSPEPKLNMLSDELHCLRRPMRDCSDREWSLRRCTEAESEIILLVTCVSQPGRPPLEILTSAAELMVEAQETIRGVPMTYLAVRLKDPLGHAAIVSTPEGEATKVTIFSWQGKPFQLSLAEYERVQDEPAELFREHETLTAELEHCAKLRAEEEASREYRKTFKRNYLRGLSNALSMYSDRRYYFQDDTHFLRYTRGRKTPEHFLYNPANMRALESFVAEKKAAAAKKAAAKLPTKAEAAVEAEAQIAV